MGIQGLWDMSFCEMLKCSTLHCYARFCVEMMLIMYDSNYGVLWNMWYVLLRVRDWDSCYNYCTLMENVTPGVEFNYCFTQLQFGTFRHWVNVIVNCRSCYCELSQLWKHPCAQVIFDSDPAQKDKTVAAQLEEMSQAMIRSEQCIKWIAIAVQ